MPYEKVGKNEPVCIADDVPFEIPDSWEWVRIKSLGAIIRGSGIKRNETVGSGYPCVRYGEIYTTYNTSFTSTVSFIPEEINEKDVYKRQDLMHGQNCLLQKWRGLAGALPARA